MLEHFVEESLAVVGVGVGGGGVLLGRLDATEDVVAVVLLPRHVQRDERDEARYLHK